MSSEALAAPGAHGSHHKNLAHHFRDLVQQKESAVFGMWVFLVTEIMFFGGLFMAYLVYRHQSPMGFQEASHHLNIYWGAANTAILIISSLTMALAVRNAQLGKRKATVGMLFATLIFGGGFLTIKSIEYWQHFHEGLFPGTHFTWNEVPALAPKVQLFMTFYWSMTGLHALHMVIGAGLLIWMMMRAWRGDFGPEYYGPVEIMGLYWHFVDIVWIFLFPFLYLIHGVHHG